MKHRLVLATIAATALTFVLVPARVSADPNACESLSSLKLPETTITAATLVPAGMFTPPVSPGADVNFTPKPMHLRTFCRVQLTVMPAIKIEVWMPASGWNGDFEGIGIGGFAGSISYAAMGPSLQAGYATASTDTGHEGGSPIFLLNHPERLEDFGYRGIHEMTVKAKQVIKAFYGAEPRRSFFTGCSGGGGQALTEAQRYPEDYNGIVAGDPSLLRPDLMVAHLVVGLWTLKDEESYIPPTKLPAIQAASIAACDARDGLKDGLVSDPRKCNFDPAVLLCKGDDSATCLTSKQVKTLKNLYSPVTYNGKTIYPRHFPGGETVMANFTTGPAPYKGLQYKYGVEYMQDAVFSDPKWDFRTWDPARDLPLVNNQLARSATDNANPDLRPFRDHGGKLILYNGWQDDDVSPYISINYFKAVVAKLTGVGTPGDDGDTPETPEFDRAAGQVGNFFRVFLVPGMGHCQGGPGTDTWDRLGSLTNWVENKQAPDRIIASHMTNGAIERTRPLCPYPQTAQYTEQGSIDNAANFVCKLPK